MANNTKNTEALMQLRKTMAEYPGSQRRTADKYGCSVNWVWRVLHEQVEVSPAVLRKMTDCVFAAIDDIKREQANKQQAQNVVTDDIINKLQAISA